MFTVTPFVHRNHYTYWDPFETIERAASMKGFATDIKDMGEAYLLEAELPGFSKEEIGLSLDGQLLTISAERKCEETARKEAPAEEGTGEKAEVASPVYLRRERACGVFSRSFKLGEIDTENIEATYENGLLSVKLPKKRPQEPAVRQLPIR